MVDPASIAIGAAIGGAAGKFVDKAWNLGEKWISSYFKDHEPKAMEKAKQNSLGFLSDLAQRVKNLEEQGQKQKKTIEDSLNQPDFSILLQKAMISSAQTDDKQKHELLARLVSDRLTKESESLFSLTSKLACDAISMLSVRQMKILGLSTSLLFIRPIKSPQTHLTQENISDWYTGRIIQQVGIYQDITISDADLLHMVSLSCIDINQFLGRSLENALSAKLPDILSTEKTSNLTFDYQTFVTTDVGEKIEKLWGAGLQRVTPTTVGQLIGVYVGDMLSNTTTSLNGYWKDT